MTEPRERLNLTECKNPYDLPIYVDDDENYWISVHIPACPPDTPNGFRLFLRTTLFNFDQLEFPGAHMNPYTGDNVTLIFDPDSVRFESEVVGGPF